MAYIKHVEFQLPRSSGEVKLSIDFEALTDLKVNGKLHTGGRFAKFIWNKQRFSRPLIVNLKSPSELPVEESKARATELVKEAVEYWVKNLSVSDNPNPVSPSVLPLEPWVSQLIKAGHVRVPCVKNRNGNSFLCHAAVVNPSKLAAISPAALAAAMASKAFLNTKADEYCDLHGISDSGNFMQYIRSVYGTE